MLTKIVMCAVCGMVFNRSSLFITSISNGRNRYCVCDECAGEAGAGNLRTDFDMLEGVI